MTALWEFCIWGFTLPSLPEEQLLLQLMLLIGCLRGDRGRRIHGLSLHPNVT